MGFDEATVLQLLRLKTESLILLDARAKDIHAWRNEPKLDDKFFGTISGLYAHYAQWTLAHSQSRSAAMGMLLFKLGKITVSALILKTIFQTLIAYGKCPARQGFTLAGGYADWSSLDTPTCFNEYTQRQ